MYAKIKSNCLVTCLVAFICFSGNTALATPKTWTKDVNGRVLVYRAEPLKGELALWSIFAALGIFFSYASYDEFQNKGDKFPGLLMGALGFSGFSAWGINKWVYNYNSLYKPLIVIDKFGITQEGYDKISWKRICNYREMQRIMVNNGIESRETYLEISTDVQTYEIYERDIAISVAMLYKLVDEAYQSYQKELEK